MTETSAYCVYPQVNSAFRSAWAENGPQVLLERDRRPWLHPKIQKFRSSILLHKYDNNVRPFNGNTVSQDVDVTPDYLATGAVVTFQPSRYFDLLCGDYFVEQQLQNAGDVEVDGASLVTTEPESDGSRRLLPLQDSKSSNSVGVSTVAFDIHGRLILILQGENALSSAGLLAPSGSGSLEPRDYDSARLYAEKHAPPGASTDGLSLREFVVEGMERELIEEANIRPEWIERSHLTGYFRWLSKGGKPEYCGVTVLNVPVDTLKRRRSERRWVSHIVVGVEVDHHRLAAHPTSPADALLFSDEQRGTLKVRRGAPSTSDEHDFDLLAHRLSTPLLLSLRFYGEFLRARSLDPDSWFHP